MKEFTPIVLLENIEEHNEYIAESETKIEAIKLLKDYVHSYKLQPTDWNTFQSDAVGVVCDLIKQKYSSDFPSYIKVEKLVDFIDFDLVKFQQLISAINEIQISVDFNTMEIEQKDFRIKTTNIRQNEMFLRIDKAISALQNIGCHLYGLDLQKATSGYIAFNLYEGGKIKPNHNLILQIK
ncbi:MAG: hypothetical protein RL308_961 [Bacteroidota bacterium]|jgi:hypothetical protein